MDKDSSDRLQRFLGLLGLDEGPMGLYYTDVEPEEATAPKPGELPTREREAAGTVDWGGVFGNFSCVMGHIWRARRKRGRACFSAQRFGCPGGAFWLGFLKPQSETIIHYVSSGIPDRLPGEHYCESPDRLREMFLAIDPPPAGGRFCVVQPVEYFGPGESPELVVFFARPESLSGLHQLATFVTNDPEIVASPWTAACGSIATWPRRFAAQGRPRAVLGGWDPSARKFFKTDELTFTVPAAMFDAMLSRFEESFLTTHSWETVRKKIERSRRAWGEAP